MAHPCLYTAKPRSTHAVCTLWVSAPTHFPCPAINFLQVQNQVPREVTSQLLQVQNLLTSTEVIGGKRVIKHFLAQGQD